MPRFYLHVCNGTGFTEDQDGLEFPGLEEARDAAIRGLREILAGELKEGQLNQASFVEIVDDAGELQNIVSFEDAVNVTAERPDSR